MVTNEFNQDNLPPGKRPVADKAFDVKYEDGHIKIIPGSDLLHLVSGNFNTRPIWPGVMPILIPPVPTSFSSSSDDQLSTTFTQNDRNRMIHIEQQLEELGNNIKLLLNHK